jgi:hypothetical protein
MRCLFALAKITRYTGVLLLSACFALPSFASHLLQCDVSYAGTTYKLKATPTKDPYSVPSVDIGGRFFFKMVLTEANSKLEHVLIYAYFDQQPRPILLQQAKYSGPFPNSPQPYALTGEQRVYGGPVERELIYSCWLSTMKP